MSNKNKKSFSSNFERDYSFYLNNKHIFTFAGSDIKNDYGIQFSNEVNQDNIKIPYSSTGDNAKICFWKLDSQGKCNACSEPQLLVEILTCKASINLQIKMWAQSRAEFSLSEVELLEDLEFYHAPEWVFKAIENQKFKILKEWIADKKYHEDNYKQTFTFHLSEILEKC